MARHGGPNGAKHDAPHVDTRIRYLRQALQKEAGENGDFKVQTLRNAIFDLIERGFWRPGDKIPPEKELGDVLGLSLGTVHAAMRNLAFSGLVERRRGSGSYVADAKEIGSTVWHFRFRGADGASLLPWRASVFAVDEIEDQGMWSDFMGFLPSYIRVRRIVTVADAFNVYSEVYLDGTRFRPLLDIPLDVLSDKNLRVFLHERYNTPTMRAVHRVTACRIPKEFAGHVGCEPDSEGLDLKALSYTYRDAPFSFQRIIIPKTPYELEILG